MRKGKRLIFGCLMITLAAVSMHCGPRDHKTSLFEHRIVDTIRLGKTILGISVIKAGLNVPWDILWGPDELIWFTDQDGMVCKINPVDGKLDTVMTLPGFYRKRLALASMVFHTNMKDNPYVFFNHLFLKDSAIFTRILRYTYNKNGAAELLHPITLLEYPGHAGHNGSRMVISPDDKLMIATGDAFIQENAQDTASVSGKILRLNIDGSIPGDNPIPGNPMWSMGFRVPQGLVYSAMGNLYSAEHGDATDDEINLITRGANYGYPIVTGKCDSASELDFCSQHQITAPIKAWTPTIAPAGIAYYNNEVIPEWTNALLVTTLKDQSLRILKLNDSGKEVVNEQAALSEKLGRLRDVCVSPSGDIYLSTSNRDWNPPAGFPSKEDDRIIRLSAMDEQTVSEFVRDSNSLSLVRPASMANSMSPGQKIYSTYCASCHKPDGRGLEGSFPSLKDAPILYGPRNILISMALHGSASRKNAQSKYDQQMPGFAFLSDDNIADVIHYIRKQFGNSGERVFVEEVAKVRSSN